MPAPDGNGNYPFVQAASVRVGSFITSDTEDGFCKHIYRAKAYRLVFDDPLVWHTNATDEVLVVPGSETLQIESGQDTETPFSAYVDENDIVINWRETRQRQVYEDPVYPAIDQVVDIRWGPEGLYENADGGAVPGSGTLTSSLLFIGDNSDVRGWLGTEQNLEVAVGVFLTEAQGINLLVQVDGLTVATLPLYGDDGTDLTDDFWTSTDIVLEIIEWWPWVVDGTDTWNTTTGEQEEDPLRNDTDGNPRALCATHHLV